MALIECPDCNRQVSDQADSCPSCGHPVKSRSKDIPGHGIPALFSFFVPGLGQLIKGDYLGAASPWIAFFAAIKFITDLRLLILALIAIWIGQIVETYRVKTKASWRENFRDRSEALSKMAITPRALIIILFSIIGVSSIAFVISRYTPTSPMNQNYLPPPPLPQTPLSSTTLVPLSEDNQNRIDPCVPSLKDMPKIYGVWLGMTDEEFIKAVPGTVKRRVSEEYVYDLPISRLDGPVDPELHDFFHVVFQKGCLSFVTVTYPGSNYTSLTIDALTTKLIRELHLPDVGWRAEGKEARVLDSSRWSVRISTGREDAPGFVDHPSLILDARKNLSQKKHAAS